VGIFQAFTCPRFEPLSVKVPFRKAQLHGCVRERRWTLGTLGYTLRQFRLSPVLTSAAVLTLALGIGGTTAIFTLIHAVMLRSLPVSDPTRLYRIGDGDQCCMEVDRRTVGACFLIPCMSASSLKRQSLK